MLAITSMTASDYAAWYGAVVATALLIWDIVKWTKAGPQIKAEARAGWRTFGFEEEDGHDVTFVKATNIGDRPTTITSWGLYWQPTGVSKHDKKQWKAFIIKGGLVGSGEIPKKLEPGDVWTGISKETDEFRHMLVNGKLFIALGFSHAEKETIVEVITNNALQGDGPSAARSDRA